MEHNRRDLLSMVELAIRMGRMLDNVGEASDAAPSDLLGLGSIHEDRECLDAARACYEAALVGASTTERAEALFRLARLADPVRELDRSIQLLSTVATFNVDKAIIASIELAKLLEHRKRDTELALQYARRAMWLMKSHPHATKTCDLVEISHRIARLERKVATGSRTTTSNGNAR
jgi:hypothetical protein